jgi:hypothetical protein
MRLSSDPEFDPMRRPLKRDTSGRFVRRIARGWSRCPVLPWVSVAALAGCFEQWLDIGAEGAVLINPDGRAGGRAAKRKVKVSDTLGCVVKDLSDKVACLLVTDEGPFSGAIFTVQSAAWSSCLAIGDAVDVVHNGWYNNATPRFPRIDRLRTDLH